MATSPYPVLVKPKYLHLDSSLTSLTDNLSTEISNRNLKCNMPQTVVDVLEMLFLTLSHISQQDYPLFSASREEPAI
jgi:hypothetical protein